jgi:hypothetical protein
MTERKINGLLAIFFVILAAGFPFHQSETFARSLPGHLIGIAGTAMVFLTLVYPFRKRVLGKRGRQNLLSRHIFYGLAGSSLVVIHSAHKLDSQIGLLTFVTMLMVVLSGIVGRFLFQRVNRSLKEQQRELAMLKDVFQTRREEIATCHAYFGLECAGKKENKTEMKNEPLEEEQEHKCQQLFDLAQSISELEYTTTVFDSTRSLFSRWTRLHHFLVLFLFSFVILHILTVLYYGLRWIP